DVLHLEAVLSELLLHALLVAPPAGHAEVAHDRRVAEARVDDDRDLAARDEEAERRHLLRLAGLERQHEEARVELDVAQVEDLHFETHSLLLGGWMTYGADYPPRGRRPPSHVRMRVRAVIGSAARVLACAQAVDAGRRTAKGRRA